MTNKTGLLAISIFLMVAGLGTSLLAADGEVTLAFPQFVSGAGNNTRIILRNNGEVADSGEILFRDQEGNPATVFIEGMNRTSLSFSLPPYGVLDVVTSGDGVLQAGSVAVVSDRGSASALEGTLVFTLLGFRASVPASDCRPNNQVYVTRNSNENTGFAAFNPDPDEAATFTARLLDQTGTQRGTREVTIPPLQRISLFVDDPMLFQSFFDGLGDDSSFKGTLNAAADGNLAVIGLVQDLGDFSLIVTETSENGDFPNILPPPPPPTPAAALCGCSAEVDTSNPSRVGVHYGMEGVEIDSYANNNRLSFEYLQDDFPVSLGSTGISNVNIVGCGEGFFYALGLTSFPTANQVRLTLKKTDGSDPIQCVARFKD